MRRGSESMRGTEDYVGIPDWSHGKSPFSQLCRSGACHHALKYVNISISSYIFITLLIKTSNVLVMLRKHVRNLKWLYLTSLYFKVSKCVLFAVCEVVTWHFGFFLCRSTYMCLKCTRRLNAASRLGRAIIFFSRSLVSQAHVWFGKTCSQHLQLSVCRLQSCQIPVARNDNDMI